MSQKITWNFRVIHENPFLLFQFSANFSFGAKFDNEVQQTLCRNFSIKSTTHNASKTLSCIKIYPLKLKISSIACPKPCEIGWKSDVDFSWFHTFFGLQLVRLWYKIAFWKRYELQVIWFKFWHKVCWTSFSNLAPKLKFAKNWKS
jgi:hypothetical protein